MRLFSATKKQTQYKFQCQLVLATCSQSKAHVKHFNKRIYHAVNILTRKNRNLCRVDMFSAKRPGSNALDAC